MEEAQTTPPTPPQQPQATATQPVDEKTWALFAHLSGLSGLLIPFGMIIGPLVVWLMGKDKSPFIDRHGKEALNFGITMAIAAVISFILVFVIIGIFLLIAVGVVWLIFVIMATIKASNHEEYEYPISIRFIK